MTGRPQIIAARSVRIISFLLIVAALYFTREIMIPAALGLLLSFLLQPMVRLLERWRLPHVLAVVLTVGCFLGAVGGIALLVGNQMIELSMQIPNYRENLREKIRDLRLAEDSPLTRLTGTLRELGQEFQSSTATTAPAVAEIASSPPVRVEVVDEGTSLPVILASLMGPLMVPLVGMAATILLLIFILMQYDDLRARLGAFAGMRRISLTTSAMSEIGERVGRFVRMQIIVNLSYGIMVGTGLFLFGLPQALLWGVMGTVLRFAPYIGPWLSSILPCLLALAIFPGWGMALGVAAMFIIIELVTNMILEPWLYGSGTGLTSLGVVVASIFWAWVWGPMGLLLAVPTTVCLTVIGKYLPTLAILNVMFGTDVEVSKVGQLYQDLLAGDATATDRMMDRELEQSSLAQICDEILLPALMEMKRDLATGAVDAHHARQALRMLESVVIGAIDLGGPLPEPRIVCIAGRSDVDGTAARLLALSCQTRGIGAEAISAQVLAGEAVEYVTQKCSPYAAIVQVAPISAPYTKRMIRALEPRCREGTKLINVPIGEKPAVPSEGDQASAVQEERTFAAVVEVLAEQETLQPNSQVKPPKQAVA